MAAPRVVLFHSMFGRRTVEEAAAGRLRDAGCTVLVPDLFEAETVTDMSAGYALMERIGWSTIVDRAREALRGVPNDAILMGLSMGVGVLGAVWPERRAAAAVICLLAPTTVPPGIAAGTPVLLHVGADDPVSPPAQIEEFRSTAADAHASVTIRVHPHVGHFFLDESLADYDEVATTSAWEDILQLVRR